MPNLDRSENSTPALPDDLIRQGFKLIVRAPDRMFAVSTNRGGTVVSATIEEVITNARAMAAYIEWREKNGYSRKT